MIWINLDHKNFVFDIVRALFLGTKKLLRIWLLIGMSNAAGGWELGTSFYGLFLGGGRGNGCRY